MRTVIIVSPHFPPSTLAGVHRARHLAKHLPTHGWRPIVLRAAPEHYSEPGDPELAGLVPPTVEQIQTGALSAALCRRLGIGDIGLRAYPHLARALTRAVARERPSAVLITGSPFYPLLLGRGVKARSSTPVVLDFQDPWVSAHGARQPRLSKAGASHRLATILEPLALRAADAVTSVSETQNDDMAARYPWLARDRMAAIPIGGDPDDFEVLRRTSLEGVARLAQGDVITLSYVGAFLPRAAPVLRPILKALSGLRATHPALASRLRLNFVGTSNQPDGFDRFQVMPLAAEHGVQDLVHETPQRVPYLDALRILAASDGLLLIGSDEPHYTASKIYPALMSGRPFLSVFHAASSAHAILSSAGGGRALSFADAEQLEGLQPAIGDALVSLASTPENLGHADPAAYADYTASAVARRFAILFDQVAP